MNISLKATAIATSLLLTQFSHAECAKPTVKGAEYVGCLVEGLSGVVKPQNNNEYIGGYVDKNGKTIIPFVYAPNIVGEGGEDLEMNDFSEGLVAVGKKTDPNANIFGQSIYGFIDKTGKTVIPFQYTSAENFSDGLAVVGNDDNRYGYIDKNNRMIIPARFDSANSFSEGLARVSLPSNSQKIKTQYIDKTGKVAVSVDGDARDFSNGLAVFIKGDKYGFINKAGAIVIPIKYRYYEEDDYADSLGFVNGKAQVTTANGKKSCINTQGKTVNCH
ncbi:MULTISPECIES: WG repeat-containing protein [unclassified Moraxella]|uniref:WG repeat-containing protein n=1 Tax=unclassified Moraxella TaxID=2685852 RepID=UPI003AF8C398